MQGHRLIEAILPDLDLLRRLAHQLDFSYFLPKSLMSFMMYASDLKTLIGYAGLKELTMTSKELYFIVVEASLERLNFQRPLSSKTVGLLALV